MDEDNAPMAFPNGYVYSREVRTASDNPFPSPFSALNLVYFILLITWNNGSGFGRDVGAKRGKSQVSAHSGRVRVLQIEKGIHILILAFLLYSTARHCTIAFLPHCTCMIPSLLTSSTWYTSRHFQATDVVMGNLNLLFATPRDTFRTMLPTKGDESD